MRQISMFKEKKLAVLINLFADSNFKDSFLEKGKNFAESQDIILVQTEESVPQSDKLVKFLKKQGKFQEFEPLRGQGLKNWIKKEFAKYQNSIEPMALEKLVVFVGNDLWRLSQEIKKLVAFKNGEVIETKDVNLLVQPKIEMDIFKTIDAIALQNKKQALNLVHKHLEKGDSPLYLLAMINFQFRNILIIKDLIEKRQPYYSILEQSNLHPFVAKKSYQQAARFTYPELKKIYQTIFQIDLDAKTGRVDPQAAIDLFIAQLGYS